MRQFFYKLFFIFLFSPAIFANNLNPFLKVPGTLSVCSYSQFKPVSYADGQGYEPELLRAIAKVWHVKIKFYPEDIYEGIWRQPSRAYTVCDIATGGISPLDSRRKQGAIFSIPTTRFKQSLLIRTTDYKTGRIKSYDDFKNGKRKIGVVPGTTGEEFAYQRAREKNIDPSIFVRYPSEAELLPALKEGKIDAIARGEIGNEYQASLDPKFTVIDRRDFGESFSFVVFQPKLLNKLNHAIDKITRYGKIGFCDWVRNKNVFSSSL